MIRIDENKSSSLKVGAKVIQIEQTCVVEGLVGLFVYVGVPVLVIWRLGRPVV